MTESHADAEKQYMLYSISSLPTTYDFSEHSSTNQDSEDIFLTSEGFAVLDFVR